MPSFHAPDLECLECEEPAATSYFVLRTSYFYEKPAATSYFLLLNFVFYDILAHIFIHPGYLSWSHALVEFRLLLGPSDESLDEDTLPLRSFCC